MSPPPRRLTLWFLEPLAARPAPLRSSPPWSEVVARNCDGIALVPEPSPPPWSKVVTRGRDGIAALLFLLWNWEMRARTELHEWKHALNTGYAWGQIFTGWGL